MNLLFSSYLDSDSKRLLDAALKSNRREHEHVHRESASRDAAADIKKLLSPVFPVCSEPGIIEARESRIYTVRLDNEESIGCTQKWTPTNGIRILTRCHIAARRREVDTPP